MDCDKQRGRRSVFSGDALEELAEGFTESEDFSEIIGGEVRTGVAGAGAFAADLDYADDFFAGKNRGANHFLNEFGGFAGNFDAFEDGGVADGGEIVDDVRATFASGAGGDGGSAGKRNEADLFEGFGDEEIEVAPAVGNAHEGDFVGAHAEIFGDAMGDAGE